jgi:membrane protein DedA with SNARE-associated domain
MVYSSKRGLSPVTVSFASFIAFVSAHPVFAYVVVWLVAMLEAVPVFGSLIPGSSIIIGLSALISSGVLNLTAMATAAVTGAFVGDNLAFLVGHRQQRQILAAWPLSLYPKLVERCEEFFNRYGRVAVFLGRFIAPIRAFIPVTAGAVGMPARTFVTFDIPAILLWASVHILPGMEAGSLLEQWGVRVKHWLIPAMAVGAAIWLVIWAVMHLRRNIARSEAAG